MKILSVGAELFHGDRRADGHTDRQKDRHDEVNCRFRSFTKAPKNENNEYKSSISLKHLALKLDI